MFSMRSLSVLSYAQGFTLWVYFAPGLSLSQVLSSGFFDSCADIIAPGDMILVSKMYDGGAQLYVQSSGSSGVVVSAMRSVG